MKDDAQLVNEAAAGNSAAFGELVTRYQDRLYNTMVHVVGSADAAQDAVQDALVQAYVKLETYKGASAFYTWLYRIAFNLAISNRRRQKPWRSVDQARNLLGQEPLDRAPHPGARLEHAERAAQVQNGLKALSEEHRAILILREIDNRSYEDIAEILDLPVGTIRSRLHRARLQLREQLKGILQEETT